MSRPGSSSASSSSRGPRIFRACALAIAVLAAASCTNLEVTAPPVATLGVRGRATATLEAGRRIYLESCSRCHVAEPVRDYPAARWPGIIADMGERTKLSVEQHRQVLAYVLAASQ